ncbi:MAG TPA: glycosyltransferase [Patescibacteria group bacterium]|nr:glycosyltransferase [Patescibacteria group bacterium]
MGATRTAPKVAIVHDWLIGGGAERVVFEMHRLFPDAPIYTSYATEKWRADLDNKVVTGWLQHLGTIRKFIPFLRIWWFTHLDLSRYDLVISSSGAEAKGIKVPKGVVHVNYCHAPTHYYWSRYDEYMAHPGFGVFDPLARAGLKLLVGPLRKWDYRAAQRPDYMIANSNFTRAEIKKYYGREATVIHPPVLIDRFERADTNGARNGFLVGGRLTPYKRADLAVMACAKLGLPLTVFGDGPDLERLKGLSGPTITFTGYISDEAVVQCFAHAQAYIFPLVDDFGVVGIESLAAGTPVISPRAGGALDYIQEGKTGLFFEQQTVESLGQALQEFNLKDFKSADIKVFARQFSPETFRKTLKQYLDKIFDK